MKNKRAWIRIVEAFVAILLIMGFLVISISNFSFKGEETRKMFDIERGIFRELQLNNTMREEITNANIGTTLKELSGDLNNKVNEEKLNYINCTGKICSIGSLCGMESLPEESIYTQEGIFFATPNTYSPRKLKLFCWEK